MGKIHPRRKENSRCLPAGSWNRSPPVSNLLLTIQEATRLEKVCVCRWGGAVFQMQWTELGELVRRPETRFRGQLET